MIRWFWLYRSFANFITYHLSMLNDENFMPFKCFSIYDYNLIIIEKWLFDRHHPQKHQYHLFTVWNTWSPIPFDAQFINSKQLGSYPLYVSHNSCMREDLCFHWIFIYIHIYFLTILFSFVIRSARVYRRWEGIEHFTNCYMRKEKHRRVQYTHYTFKTFSTLFYIWR